MAEAMDRARSVEQLQLDRKDRLEAALEDSGKPVGWRRQRDSASSPVGNPGYSAR